MKAIRLAGTVLCSRILHWCLHIVSFAHIQSPGLTAFSPGSWGKQPPLVGCTHKASCDPPQDEEVLELLGPLRFVCFSHTSPNGHSLPLTSSPSPPPPGCRAKDQIHILFLLSTSIHQTTVFTLRLSQMLVFLLSDVIKKILSSDNCLSEGQELVFRCRIHCLLPFYWKRSTCKLVLGT